MNNPSEAQTYHPEYGTSLSDASRPIVDYIDWQIPMTWAMYVMFIIALMFLSYGFYRRIRVWRAGKEDGERLGDLGKRFGFMLGELLTQRRVRNMGFPAVFHSFIFYGFIVLVITTAVVALDTYLGTSIFKGWPYVILTVGSEIAGLLILIGVGMALWRRHVSKPKEIPQWAGDTWALALIFLLVFTGYLVAGLRLAAQPSPWEALSFIGVIFSMPFRGLEAETSQILHMSIWWFHTILAMVWIGSIPYTKFAHLFFLPANAFLAKMKPRGELARENVLEMMESDDFDEESFQLGVQKTTEFTWKQLLDLDACIRCGRCEMQCPSTQAGEPFGPRQFLDECSKLHEGFLKNRSDKAEAPDIVENAFNDEFLWFCRTCAACMEICPAFIDHVDDMITVKRNEIMMHGRTPSEGQRFLQTMENQGNPFATQSDRVDFIRDVLGARVIGAGEEVDVLYFIGCVTTFDLEKQKIARDVCKLLDEAGVDWGVLGDAETCCGDPARVMGQELQFQTAAVTQTEELNSRKFNVLMTACPHCLNTLKYEYPQFDGNYQVMHHSEYLMKLVEEGKLKLKTPVGRKTVFHDPCYLGRYHGEYDAPRKLLRTIPGMGLEEMESHHSKSLCCGGGGGHFFMDLKGGSDRVNNMRVEQAKTAGGEVIATACGFCMGMLEDAVKTLNLEDSIEVRDIAALLVESSGAQAADPEKKDAAAEANEDAPAA